MRIRPWAIGLFLVVGFALLTAILFLIGNREKAFSRHMTVYAEFNNVAGVLNGAKVRVSGFDAGELKSIQVPNVPSGRFRLKLQVEDKLNSIIREDSLVSIQTEGVVGDKFIAIQKGSDRAEEAKDGMTLPSKEPIDMGELIAKGSGLLSDVHGTISDVQGRVDGALDSITKTVNHVDGVVSSVTPNLQHVARNSSHITAQLDRTVTDVNDGKGSVGLLLRDDETRSQTQKTLSEVNSAATQLDDMTARADQTIANFQSRKMLAKADVTLDNVQSMAEELNTTVKDAVAPDDIGDNAATNLRETLSNLNRGTRNIADDGEALKHNFFLRGFFKKRGYYSLDQLTPREYTHLLQKEKGVGARDWLPAYSLVTTGRDGVDQLSDSGRRQIDAFIAPVVDSLGDNLIIVEGYSDSGTPDQQFVRSRRRADLVRTYLEAHFHVRHESVGIVPLLSKPPLSTARNSWDGAAIVLLRQKRQ